MCSIVKTLLTAENDPDFLDSIINGNETRCFQYDSETKCQSAVNGEYYIGILHRLWRRIGRVSPEYPAGKQLFLLHDNAAPHRPQN